MGSALSASNPPIPPPPRTVHSYPIQAALATGSASCLLTDLCVHVGSHVGCAPPTTQSKLLKTQVNECGLLFLSLDPLMASNIPESLKSWPVSPSCLPRVSPVHSALGTHRAFALAVPLVPQPGTRFPQIVTWLILIRSAQLSPALQRVSAHRPPSLTAFPFGCSLSA